MSILSEQRYFDEFHIECLSAIVPLLLHKAEGSIYGPSGLSCGVRPAFPKDQFIFHLLPVKTLDNLLYDGSADSISRFLLHLSSQHFCIRSYSLCNGVL